VETRSLKRTLRIMTVIDHSKVRKRPRWFAWPTLLSGVLFGHFLMSIGIWVLWLTGILRDSDRRNEFMPWMVAAAPAFLLFTLSAIVLVLALRGRAIARVAVLVVLLASVALFWFDIRFKRYQISVDIATKEYWASGGRAHEYFTWWWYNDRRFGGGRPGR
jgi:hypothetical protein